MNDVKVWWLKKKYADFLSPRTVFALTFQTVKTDGKKALQFDCFNQLINSRRYFHAKTTTK